MKGSYWGWYGLIGVVVLAPVGVRVLTWPGFRRQAIDPAMAQAGQTLFLHEWKAGDPLSPGGDGLGPVYNAASCVACHHQGGPGGAGGLEHNVTAFTMTEITLDQRRQTREGVVHSYALGEPDKLSQVHHALPAVSRPTLAMLVSLPGSERSRITFPSGVHLSQRNTPALFGANQIDALPDRVIIANERKQRLKWGLASAKSEDLPVGRAHRLADGRIGHFGWKAQSASLSAFVQAACANELGLSNPGQAQPRPLGKPNTQPTGLDLIAEQCDQITSFVASLPQPVERLPDESRLRDFVREEATAGKRLFERVGCADCHAPSLGEVKGLYSDLLLHDMGQPLEGGGSYNEPPPQKPDAPSDDGPQPGEWRTPPLWGVADSAPYLHDGRAWTLDKAIELHGGQAARSARSFAGLSKAEQAQVIAFLKTLRAP
ncbi:MAG TPA: di-heme oxidoredictase family protein [Gemmataceae bacterium]|nr:di-heme oxidoredictase family protein [Gemmataceae bacterium]